MKRLTIILAMLVAVSCRGMLQTERNGEDIDLSVYCECSMSKDTRSSNKGADTKITDLCIFVFDRDGNSVSACYYEKNEGISGRELFINRKLGSSFSDKFAVYVIANVGDITDCSDILADGLPDRKLLEKYRYRFSESYDEFIDKGYPMSSVYQSYCPADDKRTLFAQRLVSRYDILFTQSSGNPNHYEILKGQIHDVSRKIRPFGQAYAIAGLSAEEKISDGDLFSSDDIKALNSGESATLFVLENEQGKAFSNIVSQAEKKEENILASKKGLCSYVEFDVRVSTPTAVFNDVKYRFYFGDNLCDCSIHRNTQNTMTFNFDNIYVEDEGWRIDPDDPEIKEESFVLSSDKMSIIKGLPLVLGITKADNVSYKMHYDATKASRLGVSIVKSSSGNTDSYKITTSYDSGLKHPFDRNNWYKVDWEDLLISFDTDDGLIHRDFVLRVVKSPLVLRWFCSGNSVKCEISDCISWPTDANYRFSLSGKIYASNVWCSKRPLVGKNEWSCDVTFESVNFNGECSISPGDASSGDRNTLILNTNTLQATLDRLNTGKHPHRTDNWGGSTYHYSIPTWYDLVVTACFALPDPSSGEDIALTDIPFISLNTSNWVINSGNWIAVSTKNPLSMTHRNNYYPCVSSAYEHNSEGSVFEESLEYPVSGGLKSGNSSYILDTSTYDKLYYMGTERSPGTVGSSFSVESKMTYSNSKSWN